MTTAPHQQLAAVTAPSEEELQLLDAYWRTANYLAVGMDAPEINNWRWTSGPSK